MSTPYGFCITRQGNILLAKLLSSEQLKITRTMIGTGKPAEDANLMDLTDLVRPAARATSTMPITVGTATSFVIEYRNDMGGYIPDGGDMAESDGGGLSRDIYINEFAVFAEDPDEGEIMLYYGSLGDYPDSVKAYSPGDPVISRRYPVSITVVEGVEVVLDYAAGAYMTAEDIAEYCQKMLLPQFIALLPEELENQIETHNQDESAHPHLTARMRATEIALNGSATITGNGDPTIKTEGTKGQHYINLLTGTEWVCNDITEEGYIWGPVDNKKSMREILAEASATAAQAKDVAEGAAQAIAAVQNTISVIPSQSGSLAYNGNAQKPSWNNYATEMMEVTYGNSEDPEARIAEADFAGEIAAGTYKAYFKPKEDYTWGDKSKDEKEVVWTVQRATISTAPSVTGTLTYTGEAQSPAWQNYNPEQLTKEETPQTDAGTHSTSFTPTANYQWSGGDTSARAISWTIGRATVSAVPEQDEALTYTGAVQSPSWSGYNSAKLTIGGDTTGTNAGSYTATFTPTKNYQWSNGGTEARSASWSIGKAAGSLALDKTTMALNSSATFGTIVVTKAGDGAISAQSSDTGVATVNVSGNTVLVTGKADGTATITIKVAEGSNHTAPQNKTCSVTVDFSNVFGVCWDKTTSTALTRLTTSNDPNGLVTVNITTNPVPAVGTGAGSSPFDNYAPWKDMEEYNIINNAVSHKRGASGFSRTSYDTMVYIPEFYFKITESGGKRYFYISSGAKSGFTKHPGSGKYVARYNTISGYYSKSGAAPLGSMTRATARTQSKAKGSKWSQYDFATWNAVWLLYLVEFADWDSQAKIGKGNVSTSSIQNNGGTDSMTYHTGRAAGTDGQTQVQYRHIENPWGNIWEWIDGANFTERAAYVCTNPANYADDTTTNYAAAGVTLPSSGWIKDLGLSNAFPWAFLPNTNGGSETTYIPDYVYSGTGWQVLMVGGSYGNGSGAGLLCFGANDSSSSTGGYIGARLLYHP